MDENNQNQQIPKELTKKEKTQQAGKDVAELAAKGAGTYFGGPVGGAIVDKVAQTKIGQNVLNKAGKTLAKNPTTKKALAKAQPVISKNKPALNAAAGSMGGAPGGANSPAGNATSGVPQTNSSNSSNINQTSNSGFENSKSGLFSSNQKQSSQKDNTESSKSDNTSFTSTFKNSKKTKKMLLGLIGSILLFLMCIITIFIIIFGPIIVAKEAIEATSDSITDFFGSLGNWITFKGWCPNDQECANLAEKNFYNKLIELHDDYKKDGVELETELLTATVFYGNLDIDENLSNSIVDDSEEKAEKFRDGKSKLSTLARQMVTNNRINLNKYYNYLVNSYIEKNFPNLLEGLNDDDRKYEIKKIANEIMSFSPNWKGKGYLSYTAGCQHIKVINKDGTYETLELEEYVAGVVTAEFGGASLEARKAQAVAARSYVLADANSSCTIESSSRKQNYTTPSENGIEAATETSGEILVASDGSKFSTEYDSFFTKTSKDSNGSGGFYCDSSFCYSNYYKKGAGSDRSKWRVHSIKVPASWKNRLIGGHGRGMSQWGAEYLSISEGYTYTQILEYFYEDGVEIRSISDGFYIDGISFYEGENGFKGKIYFYDQTDYPEYSYGSYGTIDSHGCGPTSLSIAISSLLNEPHGPVELTDWACDNGYCSSGGSYWSLIVDAPEHYGLESKQVGKDSKSLQQVVDALRTGDSIVVAIMGPGNFTNGGHFITLTGINDNGEVMVYDPNNGDGTGNNKYWDFNLVVEQNNGAFWIISR